MKGLKGFDIIIKATTVIIALTALIASFMVLDNPSTSGRGKALLIIAVISTLLFIVESIVFRGRMFKEVSKLSSRISKTERESLLHFPAPVIIIDDRNTIICYNRRFGS